ncbi:MAG: cobalt ECF transporter T component CbiQ [Lachnospiraceae bacterium]|nr:cobalt ECF transporter T component CbiQ [Lachnospiraceae bacterium]
MSRLDNAIHELNHIEDVAGRDQWVNNIHPLVKLALTIIYIIIVVSFGKYNLSGLIGMAVYPAAVFILAELSFKDSLKRLKVVLPFVCIVGIFNPFFDRIPIYNIGSFTVTTGMISMLTLVIKGVFSVLASYLLIAITTIEEICFALRLIHVPSIIVTQVMLMYRYISMLIGEVERITKAYSLRAPGQKGIHFKVWGSLVGQLLLRSMDKAEAVYESMCLRGFNGNFYYSEKHKFVMSDIIYFAVWLIILLVFRFVPIVRAFGYIFG